jgi:hypothetical protein
MWLIKILLIRPTNYYILISKQKIILKKCTINFNPDFRIRLRSETELFNKSKSSRTIFEE